MRRAGGRGQARSSGSSREVGLDALLAHASLDRLLFGVLVGGQADPLDGLGACLHDRPLLVQGDLVFGLGDLRPGQRGVTVGLGDGLAFQPDLFVAHRDRLLHLLRHDVLPQAGPAGFPALDAHVHRLLREGHGVVAAAALGRQVAAPVDLEVVVQAALLVRGEVSTGFDVGLRGALDLVLVVRHLQVVLHDVGVAHGDEGLMRPEEPGRDRDPFRLACGVVEEDVLRFSDLAAVPRVHGPVQNCWYLFTAQHDGSPQHRCLQGLRDAYPCPSAANGVKC
ncbi:hypothetical protein BJP39_20855 [Streptomyces sp. CC77]|nr:hypothetical protein BJP39_20855 [Streptomyces sp. CC77]